LEQEAAMRSSLCRLSAFVIVAGLICNARAWCADGKRELPVVRKVAPVDSKSQYRSVLIKDVPHVRQKPDFCGEACAEMMLRKLGRQLDQDYVFDQSGLTPEQARGCYTKDLALALTNIGFRLGPVWFSMRANSAADLERHWQSLHSDLIKGTASIVCMRYDDQPETTEHFRLVLGYDQRTDEVIFHEPAAEQGGYRRMERSLFLKLWPLKYGDHQWTVVLLRMQPDKLVDAAPADGFTDADFTQHIIELRKRLPGSEFSIVLARPFVVVGDESAAKVRARAEDTVSWSVEQLKATYFAKDPKQILDVWLFKDETSYNQHAKTLFGEKPSTPYGYYSSADKALVMNISTGSGTLVHEIVHPLIESNFPKCPAWFNEGLASLYEQCGSEQGQIHGYVNWRLSGLQRSIKAKRLPTFDALCHTSTKEFYADESGTNYAQARYLCYYLQEQGLLQTFYRQFVKDARRDPSGFETLQSVLGERDMEQFQKRWQTYVAKLKY